MANSVGDRPALRWRRRDVRREADGARRAAAAAGRLPQLDADRRRPTPRRLAEVSARLCRLLRDEVLEQMAGGNAGLIALAQDWRKLCCFPKRIDEQFADGYAQAVTFGLLMARAYDIPLKGGVELAAHGNCSKSNSLIGTALEPADREPGNSGSAEDLARHADARADEVNWHTISKDKPDAWLYFYEDFLEVYDNPLRKLTGSYYTPPEVVAAMVRLVDEVLRRAAVRPAAGLASTDVTVADPAVGTGTFLLGVLRRIAATVEATRARARCRGAIDGRRSRLIRLRDAVRPVRGGAASPVRRTARR